MTSVRKRYELSRCVCQRVGRIKRQTETGTSYKVVSVEVKDGSPSGK